MSTTFEAYLSERIAAENTPDVSKQISKDFGANCKVSVTLSYNELYAMYMSLYATLQQGEGKPYSPGRNTAGVTRAFVKAQKVLKTIAPGGKRL